MNKPFQFPPTDEMVLSNGVRFIVIPVAQEGLSIAVSLGRGRYADPLTLEGCATLTASMLLKGSQAMSRDAFSHFFEERGASLFADVTDERMVIGCRMLSRFSGDLLDRFCEMLSEPAFDAEELARMKKECISALASESTDPSTLVHHCFAQQMFPSTHPAGRISTAQSIKRITRDSLVDFYRKAYTGNQAIVVLAGDSGNLSIQKIRERFESIPADTLGANKENFTLTATLSKIATYVVDKRDLTQTTILAGYAMPGEYSPDRLALSIANYIFGGGNFSSRLMERIRSKEGSTYGVSSQLVTNAWFGIFTMSTTTQTSRTKAMIEALVEEHARFVDKGITSEELLFAQKYAAGSMAFELEGLSSISEKILYLRTYGRTNEYIEKFCDLVYSLTCDQVNDALFRHHKDKHLTIVAVGNSQLFSNELSQFNVQCVIPFRKIATVNA